MELRPPLAERKRRQARERIVRAADELFSEHGFAAVSVADIADRADVGRTTFFRYFGDKQEVVFAEEQELIAAIAAAQKQFAAPAPSTPEQAIAQLREVVVALCVKATQDPDAYTRHYAFVAQHHELRARDALKLQQFANDLAEILSARGTDDDIALFASQIALACYQTAKVRARNDPQLLLAETRAVFSQALNLGGGPSS